MKCMPGSEEVKYYKEENALPRIHPLKKTLKRLWRPAQEMRTRIYSVVAVVRWM